MTHPGGAMVTNTTAASTMDSRVGLDYIVETPEYISKLAAVLDTPGNTPVKKQVFELLSALCVYNEDGYRRTIDTLECYRQLKGDRYRLQIIIDELDRASTSDYRTALLAFINCLIISTGRLQDRVRLRNEFIGCRLLTVLNKVRTVAENEPDLAVQLDVFDEQRDSDDQQQSVVNGLDLNAPLDVFYAVLRQVQDTPQEIQFLSILQHLLRVDTKEPVSDMVWDTAERLVHRATLLENRDEAARLVRAPSTVKFQCMHCHRGGSLSTVDNSTQSSQQQHRKSSLTAAPAPPPPPPPPPAPPIRPCGPPPPPPPAYRQQQSPQYQHQHQQQHQQQQHQQQEQQNQHHQQQYHTNSHQPQMSLADSGTNGKYRTDIDVQSTANIERLPQQETPVPKIRMKTINWNKIPSNKVIGRNNIWSLVADEHQHSPMADMDWTEMEGLFCQQTTAPGTCSTTSTHARDPLTASGTTRMRKENAEVTLLDGKRSLNVNIFLKQFRSSNEDIIQLVTQGEHDEIGAEKLRGLLKILPEVDELDMLKSYNGDFAKLGNAEKFLLQLTALSNYKLRIESMLLKEEFASNMGYLEPSIQAMIAAADGLMTNKALQEVLYMVLVTGNFLNSGGYAGNAAGVKLTSLQKITDIRANKPNMNLIHYVAQQAEKRNKQLLIFPDKLTVLEDASKTTVEQLQNEIKTLDSRIKKIKKIIEMPNTEGEIKTQMIDFLLMAERNVSGLQHSMRDLERTRTRLAEFFCEDSASFKLEECFRVFHGFCMRFRQAVSENARRRLQEEQANARRKQREEIMAARRKQMCGGGGGGGGGSSGAGTPVSDSDGPFLDIMFLDRRKQHRNNHPQLNGGTSEDDMSSMPPSPCVSRRRIGSFNGGQYQHQHQSDNAATTSRGDERSPDITPNGSLRRRRSRVLSEEDEGNLMDFLRTSGHDNTNRERKSWGSLDRSWARRARGNGPRKRPALLSADFSIDRERPNSPSSLLENKPILAEEQELVEQQSTNSNTTTTTTTTSTSRPREWRQKIESWLRDNESEHSPNTNRRQVTLTNRRSLEMDSENERNQTLDTVHEGKPVAQPIHRRAQSDWKPSTTIDRANVLGTLETVEVEDVQQEQQQPSPVKDKSAWRKSTLNVPNSTEEITANINELNSVNGRQQRQPVTRNTVGDPSISSRSTMVERKGIISGLGDRAASDRLTLYMRRPTTNTTSSNVEATPVISNKVEIDSDNIETPPATRKMFTPTPVDKREPTPPTQCRRMLGRVPGLSTSTEEQDTAADGQFDRFSSARRTRRYKRQSEPSTVSGADNPSTASTTTVVKTEVVRPNQLQLVQSSCPTVNSNPMQEQQQQGGGGGGGSPLLEKDARLKHWQERLRSASNSTDTSPVKSRGSRQHTGINGDDVRTALRLARLTDIVPTNNKVPKDQHDNDEGFEETQSLMSESLSQATSASGGCAYETDTLDTSIKIRPVRTSSTESKCTVTSTASSESVTASPVVVPARTQRHTAEETVQRRSVIPRRSSTVRKTDTQTSVSVSSKSGRLNVVDRSNSRASLVSSRSSLNSAVSTNTIKKMPVKHATNNVRSATRTASITTPVQKRASVNVIQQPKTAPLKRIPSGSLNNNPRPPRPGTAFMKPTTSSTTKNNNNTTGTTSGTAGRLYSSFRTTTPFK